METVTNQHQGGRQGRGTLASRLTLRERIADAIRTAVIRGELKAGARVSEPRLARRFSMSRTPVREALRQLDSEGFLTVTPRKGARVARFAEQDVVEFYELKALLEGYAARLAAVRMSERDIDRLAHLNEHMERSFAAGELKKIARTHLSFHEHLIKASGNAQLVTLLNVLMKKFQRFTIQLALSGRNREAFVQHRQLIAALRARDAEAAEKLTRENTLLGLTLMRHEMVVTPSVASAA